MRSDIKHVLRDIMKWRRAHGDRRGPLPVELRRRAGALAARHGDAEVSRELDLRRGAVAGWRARFAGDVATTQHIDPPRFVDVSAELAAACAGASVTASELSLEITRPSGTRVRVHGAMGPDAIRALLAGAFGDQP
jgi:hypothetical protein